MSAHFIESEFYCKCDKCKADPGRRVKVNPLLIEELEKIRSYFGLPVIINSGVRCPEHNAEVGGKPHSQHLLGNAADIVIRGVCPRVIYSYINVVYPNKYGAGLYKTFVHFDVRPTKARW